MLRERAELVAILDRLAPAWRELDEVRNDLTRVLNAHVAMSAPTPISTSRTIPARMPPDEQHPRPLEDRTGGDVRVRRRAR